MQTPPRFIAFEGLDGSGKSTCASALARRIDAELLTTPSPHVRRYRDDLIASLGPSQEARQLFYLATVFAASEEATRLLAAGRSVVVDRYFLSTQAYAAFRGSRLAIDGVERLLRPADVTVYMDAPLATRIHRLEHRGTSAADRETMTVDADARLRQEHLQRASLGVIGTFLRVPSEGESPEALVERIHAAITDLAPAQVPRRGS